MVRRSTNVELLVDGGASAAEQFELLRWVRCLSPQGLADPAAVVALLQQVEYEYQQNAQLPGHPITGAPTRSQAQVGALWSRGFLDGAACEQFDRLPGEWSMVDRVIAEARAAWGRLPTAGPPISGDQPPRGAPPMPGALPPRPDLTDPGGRYGQQAGSGPAPDRSLPADAIVCRTCGRQLPAQARYCGYCGIRVS